MPLLIQRECPSGNPTSIFAGYKCPSHVLEQYNVLKTEQKETEKASVFFGMDLREASNAKHDEAFPT